jgi:hypothetical protein
MCEYLVGLFFHSRQRAQRRPEMRAGRLALLALLLEAAAITANPPPPYPPPANLPRQTGRPLAAPLPHSYPPSWYYDPYTQGVAGLPQKEGY